MAVYKFIPNARWIVAIYFAAILVLGLFVFDDYGISWDEPVQRQTGLVSAKYVLERFSPLTLPRRYNNAPHIPDLLTYHDKNYGVAFELPLVAFEKWMLPWHPRVSEIYKLRHFFTFLFSWIGLMVFYLLARRHFNSWKWGLVGCTLLLTSPRIFAESFYNQKDMVFFFAYIIATYAMVVFLEKKSVLTGFWFGLATAFAVTLRMPAILLPIVALGFITWEMLFNSKQPRKQTLLGFGVYAVTAVSLTYAFWPYLWEHPFQNFKEAYVTMSKYPWDYELLYWGETLRGTQVPWHYLPVWISITTPILYIVAFILGLFLVTKTALYRFPKMFADHFERDSLVFAALALLPIAAVVILHSVLYDGWRQLYFAYGPMILIAVIGLHTCWSTWRDKNRQAVLRYASVIILGLTAVNATYAAVFAIRNHPHQNVYFNALAGTNVNEKFECDYWGLSYRQGLEQVMSRDARGNVRIRVNNWPGVNNVQMLRTQDRKRVQLVDNDQDYYLTEHRTNRERTTYKPEQEIYKIEVDGVKILSVYTNKPELAAAFIH